MQAKKEQVKAERVEDDAERDEAPQGSDDRTNPEAVHIPGLWSVLHDPAAWEVDPFYFG